MFPVAVFYYFNLPEVYEKYVSAKRVSLMNHHHERSAHQYSCVDACIRGGGGGGGVCTVCTLHVASNYVITSLERRITARVPPPFQCCNHMNYCTVHCAIETRPTFKVAVMN